MGDFGNGMILNTLPKSIRRSLLLPPSLFCPSQRKISHKFQKGSGSGRAENTLALRRKTLTPSPHKPITPSHFYFSHSLNPSPHHTPALATPPPHHPITLLLKPLLQPITLSHIFSSHPNSLSVNRFSTPSLHHSITTYALLRWRTSTPSWGSSRQRPHRG